MKFNIKTLSMMALLTTAATVQPKSSYLREFEKVKSDVTTEIKHDVQDVAKEWDEVISKIENVLHHAKTAKIAHTSLKQHAKTSEAIAESIGIDKAIPAKTRNVVKEYNKNAIAGENKAESNLDKTAHHVEKLEEHVTKTVKNAKESHTKTVAAHGEAQKALADHDKSIKAG